MHTSNLSQWGVPYGKYVQIMARPKSTKDKKYREPMPIGDLIKCRNKAEAEAYAVSLRKPIKH